MVTRAAPDDETHSPSAVLAASARPFPLHPSAGSQSQLGQLLRRSSNRPASPDEVASPALLEELVAESPSFSSGSAAG